MYIPLLAGFLFVVLLSILIGWLVQPRGGDTDRH
jgi:hypothetical protein